MSTGSISLDILLKKFSQMLYLVEMSLLEPFRRDIHPFLKKKLMKFLLWFQRLPKVTMIALN